MPINRIARPVTVGSPLVPRSPTVDGVFMCEVHHTKDGNYLKFLGGGVGPGQGELRGAPLPSSFRNLQSGTRLTLEGTLQYFPSERGQRCEFASVKDVTNQRRSLTGTVMNISGGPGAPSRLYLVLDTPIKANGREEGRVLLESRSLRPGSGQVTVEGTLSTKLLPSGDLVLSLTGEA